MKKTILVEGREYGPADVSGLRGRNDALDDLADFLDEWFSESPTVQVQTSGSTGVPKVMQVEKVRMEASARMTCSFLGLKAGDRALLCMPLKYIGAKMVVVRSILWGLDLYCVQASSHPLLTLGFAPDFLAMTPAQVYSSLESEDEAALLEATGHNIIGGGAIDARLGARLRTFPNHVWSTYGMTETLSHIALRRLNGPEASDWYSPFEGVALRLTEEGALAIHAPAVCAEELVTNDIAELHEDGRFRILGRKDNVINSGGVKIQIEAVEAQLLPLMPCAFQITAGPDAHYGEVVVMLAEGEERGQGFEEAFAALHAYSRPKHVFFVPSLPRTGSGKPDRATARAIAKERMENMDV
ncbi:MAG: AMP-binding protein [Mailhella sp.]|nr:AMP-binding protein [Mailhella sp.]